MIWLSSFPRSGNTYLRTILWQCFKQRSASIYPKDLNANHALENYAGHIEHDHNNQIQFPENNLQLLKTHEDMTNDSPAIYVVRDGRAACASLWHFYNQVISISDIVEGNIKFGTWSNHVNSWHPWDRKNTLLLKYETMRDDLPTALNSISQFLNIAIQNHCVPNREKIAGADGHWVKKQTNWKETLNGKNLERFNQLNEYTLIKTGYLKS